MKRIIIITSMIALGMFILPTQYGCKKSKNTTTVIDSVSPSDADKLQAVLIIPGGSLKTGSRPTKSLTNAPVISAYQSSAAINPSQQLMLPFNYSSIAGLSKIIVQVVGASGYIEVSGLSSSSNTGTVVLPVTIPAKVKYGNFQLVIIVIDNSGNISDYITTSVRVNAPVTCADANVSGSEGLTFTLVDMTGKPSGTMSLEYDTYSVPDRVDVYQNGTWLAGTGTNPGSTIPPQCDCSTPLPGFIGATGTLTFPYDASKSKNITVVVSGCLGGGTAWDWNLNCP